jgi:hypothetical protein
MLGDPRSGSKVCEPLDEEKDTKRKLKHFTDSCLTNYLVYLSANYLAHKERSGQPLIRLDR